MKFILLFLFLVSLSVSRKNKFIQRMKFSYALLIGGKKLQNDLKKLELEIPNIIVATPGRIFDLDEKLNFVYRDFGIPKSGFSNCPF